MATVTRGKRKGDEVAIHQFCNDWFTDEDGNVWNPVSIKLTPDEVDRVRDAYDAGTAGIMPGLYELGDDGVFKRRQPRRVNR